MADMIWEKFVPTAIAKAKEDMGVGNIWKYLRYFRMFMDRYSYKDEKGNDLTNRIENLLLWKGSAIIWKSQIEGGVVILELIDKTDKRDSNGRLTKVKGKDYNGVEHTVTIGVDAEIIYADSTRLPPVLYIWAMANELLTIQDIIRQQNNMLRKPIMVSGEGAEFDNAMTKVQNVLSSVAWFNLNDRKGKKGDSVMDSREPVQVLNLQVGNAYKGIELWDNYKHYEEFICDYLGYTTTKNEKRERMNSLEITNENSIGMTSYEAQTKERKDGLDRASKIGIKIKFEELLKSQEGGEDNGSKEKMDRTDDSK